mmetsp:Transcript_9420/g.27485  ORF Transcript_9420/g.27485 Transcript_9420/m.27485 type:complete len:295 (-) Transcript_9420:310-1194(-)
MQLVHIGALPAGFSVDTTKSSGFRVNLSWRDAAMTALRPGHNEFWNCLTDVLPLLWFGCACVIVSTTEAFTNTPPVLRQSIMATSIATCLQHACSLVSHMFTCVSARMSHAIWFVDYAGIALNFVWNAPAMALVWSYASFAWLWPTWFWVNVVLTAGTLGSAIWLAAVHKPRSTTPVAGVPWQETFFGMGVPSLVVIALLIMPNLVFTAACGIGADVRVLGVLLGLPLALGIKEAHLPEMLSPGSSIYDCSFLHSHVIWHLCVWFLQALYLLAYLRVIDGYAPTSHAPTSAQGA